MNDINIAKAPARIEGNQVICPNCTLEFIKASRCPECGQLIAYDSEKPSVDYNDLANIHGINDPENWRGDARNMFIQMLAPLVEGTEYTVKKNDKDHSSYIVDLWKEGFNKRVLGFFGLCRTQEIQVFINQKFWNEIKQNTASLPDNEVYKKSQYYMRLTFKQLWDVVQALTK